MLRSNQLSSIQLRSRTPRKDRQVARSMLSWPPHFKRSGPGILSSSRQHGNGPYATPTLRRPTRPDEAAMRSRTFPLERAENAFFSVGLGIRVDSLMPSAESVVSPPRNPSTASTAYSLPSGVSRNPLWPLRRGRRWPTLEGPCVARLIPGPTAAVAALYRSLYWARRHNGCLKKANWTTSSNASWM